MFNINYYYDQGETTVPIVYVPVLIYTSTAVENLVANICLEFGIGLTGVPQIVNNVIFNAANPAGGVAAVAPAAIIPTGN